MGCLFKYLSDDYSGRYAVAYLDTILSEISAELNKVNNTESICVEIYRCTGTVNIEYKGFSLASQNLNLEEKSQT